MTAPATTTSPALPDLTGRTSSMRRIANATRLHLINPNPLLIVPWVITAALFALAYAAWWLIDATGTDGQVSVTSAWMLVYMLVAAVHSVTRTLPYALGLGLARYEYALGSAAAFVIVSAVNAALFTILAHVEQWTDGWGHDDYLFYIPHITDGAAPARWFVFFVGFALFFFIGWVFAAAFMRWHLWGFLGLGGLLAALVVGSAALITTLDAWASVGEWFAASGPAGVAAWALIPTALAALGGYLLLLRVTPRS